jgi:hypothetical protein
MSNLICDVCGRQTGRVHRNSKYGKPLCREHDNHYNKYGEFFKWNIYNENEYEFFEDRCEIIIRDRSMKEIGILWGDYR